jgi:hypothetical protein
VKSSASFQATWPTKAPFWPPFATRVNVPPAKVDVPAMFIGGLPGPVAVQVKAPSSWITRAIFAPWAGVAAHVPASLPSTAGAVAGAAPVDAGWLLPEGSSWAMSCAETVSPGWSLTTCLS